MRKLINQIFLIPTFFLIFGLVMFGTFYGFFIKDITKKEFNKIKTSVIQNEKKILKQYMTTTVAAIDGIRVAEYNLVVSNLNNLLDIVAKNYIYYKHGAKMFFVNHYNDNMFFYIISKKLVYPKITQTVVKVGNKRFLEVIYKNRIYLASEKRLPNGTIIGGAVAIKEIDKIIQNEIISFIKSINTDKLSYLAIGKITNWFAEKGVFGKIIYHPIKNLIGFQLNMDKPDINGNYYRKKYFNCLKIKDGCFEEYYFKNPLTGRYEKKLSYFTIYRPYNYVIVKGVYYSQINAQIDKIESDLAKDINHIFVATILLLLFFTLISFFFSYVISKKIMNKIIEEYETLKQNYEHSKNELIKRYYYDQLTKLPNRNMLLDNINNYKSLILIDIDNFSDINDVYGFEFGDKVLKYVAHMLKDKYKNVFRISSDEFAMALDYEVSLAELRELSKMPLIYNNVKINITIGASNIKEKLFETAETALKLAYKDPSKTYKLFDFEMIEKQKEKLEKIQILHKVLEKEAIIPFYQCIVDQNRNVVKYESLMRIEIDGKIYSPFYFMDTLKEAKLYNKFSRIMIKKVFQESQHFSVPVSINLSYNDIVDKETNELINALIEKYSPKKIVFEILETENIGHFDIVQKFIERMKSKGIKFAIDDFGSGYSNFINILSLDPDYIKIDATLVKNINDKRYMEIISLIVDFAKKFNIKTTAEFVSDKEKFEKLKQIGVDEFQGFYFCEPTPLEDI